MATGKKRARKYSSTIRDERADDTRRRIAEAARRLFLTLGFDGTTIEAVAREAGVAAPTVYGAFRSKRGLVAELLKQARFGPGYAELMKEAHLEPDPEKRVRFSARIARQVYDSERSEMELLRGAGVLSPELDDSEREESRYQGQKRLIDFLVESRRLRPDLDVTHARDVLHALTARDLYRQLVVVRGWHPEAYQSWLADTLVSSLVKPHRR